MRTVAAADACFGCLLAAVFAVPAIAAAAHVAPRRPRTRDHPRASTHDRARHGLAGACANSAASPAPPTTTRAEMLDANYFAHASRNGGSFDARVRRYAHTHASARRSP